MEIVDWLLAKIGFLVEHREMQTFAESVGIQCARIYSQYQD